MEVISFVYVHCIRHTDYLVYIHCTTVYIVFSVGRGNSSEGLRNMRALYIYIRIIYPTCVVASSSSLSSSSQSSKKKFLFNIGTRRACVDVTKSEVPRTFLSPHQQQYSRYIILLYTITAVTVIGSRCSGTTLKAIVMVKSVCALQTVLKYI